MKTYLHELEKRIEVLTRIIKENEQELSGKIYSDLPTGIIQVFDTKLRTQYYICDNGKRTYVKVKERSKVKDMCQKEYLERSLEAARKELKQLNKLYCICKNDSWERVYEKQHPKKQAMQSPGWLPDREFVKEWESDVYEKKTFKEMVPEYYTDREERVRSKSEILIANALHKHQVPYYYEKPLHLNGYGTVHPDFTLLNVRERKTLYWEHMGMLDDETYMDYALDKITAYEKNGIFPGHQLILTHETSKKPINSKLIESIIMEYCL